MDDLDVETVTGWLALSRMVTVLSEKLRTDMALDHS
jgi:hypothetical protein